LACGENNKGDEQLYKYSATINVVFVKAGTYSFNVLKCCSAVIFFNHFLGTSNFQQKNSNIHVYI